MTDLGRYQTLAYFLIPDQLVGQWCDVPVGEVACLDRLPLLLLAGAVWGVAFLSGRLVLLPFSRRGSSTAWSSLRLRRASGSAAGRCSRWPWDYSAACDSRWIFVAAAVMIAVVSVVQAWRRVESPGRTEPESTDESQGAGTPSAVAAAWWWLAVPFVLVIVGGALLPPVDFDVLEYHLQVPREWVQSGRIAFLPHNVYGNMPLGAETLAALTMVLSPGELGWWWGALAGKLVMAGFAPLAAVLLVAAGRRFASPQAGIVAALDLSVDALDRAGFRERSERRGHRVLPAGGGLCHEALARLATDRSGCRAGVLVVGRLDGGLSRVVQVHVGRVRRHAAADRGRGGEPSCLVSLRAVWHSCWPSHVPAACGWPRTGVQTGNPVYPLLAHVLDGRTRTPEKDRAVPAGASSADRCRGTSLLAATGLAVAAVVAGRQLLAQSADHSAGGPHRAAAADAASGRIFWIDRAAVFSRRVVAVHAPPRTFRGPGVAAVGAGRRYRGHVVRRSRMARHDVDRPGLGLAANFTVVASPLLGGNSYFVSLEQLRDDPRLTTVSIAHRYLNAHVPPGRHALLVGDAGVFNLRVPVLYSTCFDTCILEELLRDRDAAQRRARLEELRVSHIYVNWAEIRRYRQPGNYGFTDYITPALLHEELERQQTDSARRGAGPGSAARGSVRGAAMWLRWVVSNLLNEMAEETGAARRGAGQAPGPVGSWAPARSRCADRRQSACPARGRVVVCPGTGIRRTRRSPDESRHHRVSGVCGTLGMLDGRPVMIAESGVGRAAAVQATEDLIKIHHPQWIVSTGFAGALVPDLQCGHILMADSIVDCHRQPLEVGFRIAPQTSRRCPSCTSGDC